MSFETLRAHVQRTLKDARASGKLPPFRRAAFAAETGWRYTNIVNLGDCGYDAALASAQAIGLAHDDTVRSLRQHVTDDAAVPRERRNAAAGGITQREQCGARKKLNKKYWMQHAELCSVARKLRVQVWLLHVQRGSVSAFYSATPSSHADGTALPEIILLASPNHYDSLIQMQQ